MCDYIPARVHSPALGDYSTMLEVRRARDRRVAHSARQRRQPAIARAGRDLCDVIEDLHRPVEDWPDRPEEV